MLLLRIDDIVSGTKKASGKEGSQSGAAPTTTTPEDWSPVPTQQTNYTSCGPLKMHNSELAHGTLSRRLQFQQWETGFETLDYNLHVRTEWSFCGSWYRCSRTEQSNQYWNLEFRIMSTSKFKTYCDRTGHRTENGHFLNYARSTSIVSRAADQIIPGLVGDIEFWCSWKVWKAQVKRRLEVQLRATIASRVLRRLFLCVVTRYSTKSMNQIYLIEITLWRSEVNYVHTRPWAIMMHAYVCRVW